MPPNFQKNLEIGALIVQWKKGVSPFHFFRKSAG